jgi:hypothetical protein
MRISIAMATYNGAQYIGQQLESLAAQIVMPYELVVTDDGSTDDTLGIVGRFAQRAPFPVHVHRNKERLNFADNFLRAASLCKGDWIAFCDQDDVWQKDKLHCVTRSIRKDVTMVVHRVQVVDETLAPTGGRSGSCRVRRGNKPHRLPPMGFFGGLCITFNAALLDLLMQRPRFPSAHAQGRDAEHDVWVSCVADAIGAVKYINQDLVLYRQHSTNTCGASAAGSMRHAVERAVVVDGSTYQSRAEMALRYSECFHRLAQSPAGERWKAQLVSSAVRYKATHDYLLARAALYNAERFSQRLFSITSMGARWSYRFNPVRSSFLAFSKDLFAVIKGAV